MDHLSLVVLAAGIGSRFGGIKQLAAVDDAGQTLADYSIFDALRAGFDRVVCVVTPTLEPDFHERLGRRLARHVDLVYAHQTLDLLPAGYRVPATRTKPWGTGHAVLAALPHVAGPFATINADDFYGRQPYQLMADFLRTDTPDHGLVAYRLGNTLSLHGTVSRGLCTVDGTGRLTAVRERKALRAVHGEPAGTTLGAEDEAGDFFPADAPVSMNLWGFRPEAGAVFRDLFTGFLDAAPGPTDEYLIPDVAAALIPAVKALATDARWVGVTYADDLPAVRQYIAGLIADGTYPSRLWA